MKLRFALLALALTAAPALAQAQEIAPPAGGCHYEIALADAEAHALAVALACAGDGPVALSTWRHRTDAQIRDLRAAPGSTLEKGDGAWQLKGAGGIARASYRFDVDALTRSADGSASGRRVGGSVVATVRPFLLLPDGGATRRALTLRFKAPPGAAVLTGLAAEGGVERLDTADLDLVGFMAMGRLDVLRVPVEARATAGQGGGGTLTVAALDGKRAVGNDELRRWIAASAARIGEYFGGFPVRRALIVLEPVPNLRYLRRGIVMGGGGATMLLRIGAETRAEDLFGQWMLMHELVHFAAPFVEGHTWLMEGMAVYVETRLRVAAGWFPRDQAWRGFLRNFRYGATAMERQGLAAARGIGPVYWGGTLFMLLADIDIIEKSGGTKSLADCFKAVLAQGGDATRRWSLARFIAVCDGATGFGTMHRLAAAHAWKGSALALAPLWVKLGVQLTEYEAGVRYDDTAPLAWVRKKIM